MDREEQKEKKKVKEIRMLQISYHNHDERPKMSRMHNSTHDFMHPLSLRVSFRHLCLHIPGHMSLAL